MTVIALNQIYTLDVALSVWNRPAALSDHPREFHGFCIWTNHGLILSFTWWQVAVQHVIKDDLYTQSQANLSRVEYMVLGTTGIPKFYVTRNKLLYTEILNSLSLGLLVPSLTLNKSFFNLWLKSSSRIFSLTKLHTHPFMHLTLMYFLY